MKNAEKYLFSTRKEAESHSKGEIVHVCRGIWLDKGGNFKGRFVLEEIAAFARRGQTCYISFESALHTHGLLSQVPMILTVATTGRGGILRTAYGNIEFTRIRRKNPETRLIDAGMPLPLASKEAALEDFARYRDYEMQLDEDEDE